jgi:hypothetical protein
MTDVLLNWLVRWVHVAAAGGWIGGYAVIALVIVPWLAKRPDPAAAAMAITCMRFLSWTGTFAMLFGLILIARTRGYASLLLGEWGAVVLLSTLITVAILAIGDSLLRPALRRLGDGGEAGPAQRWSAVALALTIIAVALMTRAPYAR